MSQYFAVFQSLNPSSLQQAPTYLPSEGVVEEVTIMDAVSVSSADGESFHLQDKVNGSFHHYSKNMRRYPGNATIMNNRSSKAPKEREMRNKQCQKKCHKGKHQTYRQKSATDFCLCVWNSKRKKLKYGKCLKFRTPKSHNQMAYANNADPV